MLACDSESKNTTETPCGENLDSASPSILAPTALIAAVISRLMAARSSRSTWQPTKLSIRCFPQKLKSLDSDCAISERQECFHLGCADPFDPGLPVFASKQLCLLRCAMRGSLLESNVAESLLRVMSILTFFDLVFHFF